jgi:lipoate-protein ligase B
MIKNIQTSQTRTPIAPSEPRSHKLQSTQNPKCSTRHSPAGRRQAKIQNPKSNTALPEWWCIDLGTLDYQEAWKLQTDIVAARNDKAIDTDLILMLEHPSVFTLGRRGGTENLLVSEAFLERSGIAMTRVERGGNITYHGPGQLVVYPIVDLEAARISIVDFVEAMEEVMLKIADAWDIQAERNSANRGIWVGQKKMGSIGIALRKGVSFHGLALNVNPDLTPFTWIQPCGLQGVSMTSMEQELSRNLSMAEVREAFKEYFESVFKISLLPEGMASLKNLLQYEKAEQ